MRNFRTVLNLPLVRRHPAGPIYDKARAENFADASGITIFRTFFRAPDSLVDIIGRSYSAATWFRPPSPGRRAAVGRDRFGRTAQGRGLLGTVVVGSETARET
ncbi:hypothetical protein GCM10010371_00250 [Streptomyces subrutilus]|uniref:Uncharacterized protein n=1 Tax=Streptomyces subrutilus TaxID=36818 RepID=A0A918QG14_9ACTN|nr:hypothetical protein GCM10010371_00250 [Streptomyces subrutilus]